MWVKIGKDIAEIKKVTFEAQCITVNLDKVVITFTRYSSCTNPQFILFRCKFPVVSCLPKVTTRSSAIPVTADRTVCKSTIG